MFAVAVIVLGCTTARLCAQLPSDFLREGIKAAQRGDEPAALNFFNKGLELYPDTESLHYNRGLLYGRTGKDVEAIADFDRTIELAPKNSEVYDRRGYAFNLLGDYDKAIASFDQAALLQPNNPEICNDVAWFLATCPQANLRDGRKAVALATKAGELSGKRDAHYLDTLAAANAEVGDFDQAMKLEDECLAYLPRGAARDNALKRLALYQAGKPFREIRSRSELTAARKVATSSTEVP